MLTAARASVSCMTSPGQSSTAGGANTPVNHQTSRVQAPPTRARRQPFTTYFMFSCLFIVVCIQLDETDNQFVAIQLLSNYYYYTALTRR